MACFTSLDKRGDSARFINAGARSGTQVLDIREERLDCFQNIVSWWFLGWDPRLRVRF